MRLSRYLLPILRETPKEAETKAMAFQLGVDASQLFARWLDERI